MIFIRSEAMTEVNGVKGNSRWPHGARKTGLPHVELGKVGEYQFGSRFASQFGHTKVGARVRNSFVGVWSLVTDRLNSWSKHGVVSRIVEQSSIHEERDSYT